MNIIRTDDYKLFKRIPGNRNVNKSHVQKLINSLSENLNLSRYAPILINEKMQVIDGQHRLAALKALNAPVYYIEEEGLGLKEVQKLNQTTKVWRPLDFAISYAELGYEDYQTYVDFKNEYKFGHNVLHAILTLNIKNSNGNSNLSDQFRNGEFKVTDLKRSKELAQCLAEVGVYVPNFKTKLFVIAYVMLWEMPGYNHKQFMGRLAKQAHTIGKRVSTTEYFDILQEIHG